MQGREISLSPRKFAAECKEKPDNLSILERVCFSFNIQSFILLSFGYLFFTDKNEGDGKKAKGRFVRPGKRVKKS